MKDESRRGLSSALVMGLTIVLWAGCAHSEQSRQAEPSEPTASPNTISSKEIERAPESSIQELLKGKIAGVRVIEHAGGISVRIRGTNSINSSNEPLYVMDGMPIEPGPGGFISISPYDIESIEVLKGPSAAAYGVRGANGVILITTKRGDER